MRFCLSADVLRVPFGEPEHPLLELPCSQRVASFELMRHQQPDRRNLLKRIEAVVGADHLEQALDRGVGEPVIASLLVEQAERRQGIDELARSELSS